MVCGGREIYDKGSGFICMEMIEARLQEKSGNLHFCKYLNFENIVCAIVDIEYRYYNRNRNIDTR